MEQKSMSKDKTPDEIETAELIDNIANDLITYRYCFEDTAHKAMKRLTQQQDEIKALKEELNSEIAIKKHIIKNYERDR